MYVLIDVLFSLAGVFVGMGLTIAYFRCQDAPRDEASAQPESGAKPGLNANDVARASMAVDEIRSLTEAVASDVGAHTDLVDGFSERLADIQTNLHDQTALVGEIVQQMLEANNDLKQKLDDAERKIQAQAEELRIQQSEASTDALTGLPNRRAFDAALKDNVERKALSGTPFSLLFLDIDHFKKFNDLHGHLAGDAVLSLVGETLPRIVKKTDKACRYGGEEFAIVMPATTGLEAQELAKRLRKALAGLRLNFEGKPLSITASIGIAEGGAGERGQQVIRRADEAVYASKEAGRNCCYWHDGLSSFLVVEDRPAPPAAEGSKAAVVATGRPAASPALSRGAFLEFLRQRIAERHRTGTPLSLLYFQIRDFAKISTEYGDAVGSLIVNAVAAHVRSSLRDMDILGQMADDSLAVLLPGNSESASRIVGERVRASVSQCHLPLSRQKMRVDVDFGSTAYAIDDDADMFMERAKLDMAAKIAESTRPTGTLVAAAAEA